MSLGSSEFLLTPHPTDPFCFTWSLGLLALGEAVLAPHKQMLSVSSPCCWAGIKYLDVRLYSCAKCGARWRRPDGPWLPAVTSFDSTPVEFITALKEEGWFLAFRETFSDPLAAEVEQRQLIVAFSEAAELVESWSAAFLDSYEALPSSTPTAETYADDDRRYRQHWRTHLPEVIRIAL